MIGAILGVNRYPLTKNESFSLVIKNSFLKQPFGMVLRICRVASNHFLSQKEFK